MNFDDDDEDDDDSDNDNEEEEDEKFMTNTYIKMTKDWQKLWFSIQMPVSLREPSTEISHARYF